jgi:MoaA/NifB/PqqE/SkfB family radical SAM enzyme
VVNFSGGEPILLGETLAEFIREATDRRLPTRVTTGAYWSPTAAEAGRTLGPLAAAGLRQIFVSLSDAHQRQVPLSNAVEAVRAARDHGITTFLAVGVTRSVDLQLHRVRQAFESAGVAIPYLLESPLIPAGRGTTFLPAGEVALQPTDRLDGPCRSLTENPTLHPDGAISACAAVFARDCPPLVYGRAPADSLEEALERMDSDPIAAWIHRRGIVALKRLIESVSAIRLPERAVNGCHLCSQILGHPEALALARAQLGKRRYRS